MTERELERQLRAWYQARVDEADSAPATLAASVWAIPDDEPARPGFFASRRTTLLLAAAMLVALVVGSAIAVGAGLIPWLDDDRDTNLVVPASWQDLGLTNSPAGRYYLDIPTTHTTPTATIRVTFDLPDGWERVQVVRLLWGQRKWMGFGVFENLFADPCSPELGVRDPPVGNTIPEIVDALRTVPGWVVTDTADAAVDGYSGMRVDLIGPSEMSECFEGKSLLLAVFGIPNGIPAMRLHEPVQIWILDVEGLPFVIRTGREPWALGESVLELQEIVESIRIDPPAAP